MIIMIFLHENVLINITHYFLSVPVSVLMHAIIFRIKQLKSDVYKGEVFLGGQLTTTHPLRTCVATSGYCFAISISGIHLSTFAHFIDDNYNPGGTMCLSYLLWYVSSTQTYCL